MTDKSKKIKLEDLLNCISETEFKEIRHSISQKALLKEFVSAFRFSKQNPRKGLPKPNKINANNWYRIRSQLKNKCLEYFVAKSIEKEPLLAGLLASKQLRNSSFPERYFQFVEDLKTESKEDKTNALWVKLRLLEEQYFYPFTHEKHSDDLNVLFQDMNANLDLITGLKKIKYGLEAWSRSKNFQYSPTVPLIPEYIELLEQSAFKDMQLVRLYTALGRLVFKKDSNPQLIINKILDIVKNSTIGDAETTTTLTFLFNYIFSKINEGAFEFKQSAGELYKVCFEKNWFSSDTFLNSIHFSNYVLFVGGLGGKNIPKVEDFIVKNQVRLNPETRKNAVTLSEAMLLFIKKEFRFAFEKIEFFEPSTSNIDELAKVKTLRIRILFELLIKGEKLPIHQQDFHRELSNFRSYFTKNNPDLSTESRQLHLNLSNKIKKLYRLWDKHSRSGISEDEIRTEKQLACKDWVLEKYLFIVSNF